MVDILDGEEQEPERGREGREQVRAEDAQGRQGVRDGDVHGLRGEERKGVQGAAAGPVPVQHQPRAVEVAHVPPSLHLRHTGHGPCC